MSSAGDTITLAEARAEAARLARLYPRATVALELAHEARVNLSWVPAPRGGAQVERLWTSIVLAAAEQDRLRALRELCRRRFSAADPRRDATSPLEQLGFLVPLVAAGLALGVVTAIGLAMLGWLPGAPPLGGPPLADVAPTAALPPVVEVDD